MSGTKGIVVGELLAPCIFAALFWLMTTWFRCEDDPDDPDYGQTCIALRSFFMPYILMFTIPNASTVNARFIIQSLVEDKAKKVRETLRLMSLSRFSYGVSIFLY